MFLSPLKRWSLFTIVASFDGWDDRWLFFKHAFVQDNKIKAFGCTKMSAWKTGGVVPVKEVLKESEIEYFNYQPSKWVQRLFENDIEDISNIKIDFVS